MNSEYQTHPIQTLGYHETCKLNWLSTQNKNKNDLRILS